MELDFKESQGIASIYDDPHEVISISSCAVYFMSVIENDYSAVDLKNSFIYVVFLIEAHIKLSKYNIRLLLGLSVSFYDIHVNDYPLNIGFWSVLLGYDTETMLRHQVNFFSVIKHTNITSEALEVMSDALSMTYSKIVLERISSDSHPSHVLDHTVKQDTHMDLVPSSSPEEMLLFYESLHVELMLKTTAASS